MGINIPNMGIPAGTSSRTERNVATIRQRASLADALFSSTQQRVLALLFGDPQRSFYANEVIGRLDAGSGAAQRELRKLADSGLVSVTWRGNQKHYQANAKSPVFKELHSLMRKTVLLGELPKD
jgi:predicted transcriptional regulator